MSIARERAGAPAGHLVPEDFVERPRARGSDDGKASAEDCGGLGLMPVVHIEVSGKASPLCGATPRVSQYVLPIFVQQFLAIDQLDVLADRKFSRLLGKPGSGHKHAAVALSPC